MGVGGWRGARTSKATGRRRGYTRRRGGEREEEGEGVLECSGVLQEALGRYRGSLGRLRVIGCSGSIVGVLGCSGTVWRSADVFCILW